MACYAILVKDKLPVKIFTVHEIWICHAPRFVIDVMV